MTEVGWYDDPERRGRGRHYWDGSSWISHYEHSEVPELESSKPDAVAAGTEDTLIAEFFEREANNNAVVRAVPLEEPIPGPADAGTSAEAVEEGEWFFCENCGTSINGSHRFCAACGHKQEETAGSAPVTSAAR